jgi:hypothetical protein
MAENDRLAEKLAAGPRRERVVEDCVKLVDEEVRQKSGFSGAFVKTAYATVKGIKPRFVPEVIDGLLDDWIARLEPYHESWGKGGGSFADYLTARSDEVAEDLLGVTDERAAGTRHKTARKLYDKMRPAAKRNVVAAIPRLGALIERHLAEAGEVAEGTGS